ncbi:MAG: cell division protein SepF [Oscillospiraceae bacterium]|jgi:cell division inhibitor SepF|nr:cell division protein SepF [Oscillospiraceae bacterium]
MSAWDKIKGILNVADDGFDDFDEDDILYTPQEKEEKAPAYSLREPVVKTTGTARAPEAKGGQVVDIHTTAKLQVVLTKPEHFDEASSIADNLNQKRTVVLNLESANREEARRLVDFLGGVAYANGGQLKRIANSTFIITPYNVDVMGDLLDELESNGVFF